MALRELGRRKERSTTWLGVIVVAMVAGPAHAATFNGEIDEFYTGVRSLGMGGTYVNTVNDETAILTNPAGLGKLRDLTFTVIDPELHGGFNDTEIATMSTASGAMTIQGLLDLLNTAKDRHWHAKAQFFPSIVGPNFGLGVLAKFQYNAEVDATGTTYRLDYVNDYAVGLGYTFRFFSGVVKIGFAGRLVNRTEIHKDLPASSTNLEVKTEASEGIGAAGDVGLILTAPIVGLPALGVTVRDVGNTSYTLREGMFNATVDRPVDTLQTVDAALSFQPILGNRARLTVAFEYHGLTTPLVPTEEDALKRSHAGLEINIADFAFLRGGANQGYWTAGVEFATERFQLQAASYGEELGTPTLRKEDRRWVGKFAIRF